MEEQLISFQTAKLAKEKGFNERIKPAYFSLEEGHRLNGEYSSRNHFQEMGYSTNTEDTSRVSVPTQSLLQKWLREKYNIHITIDISLLSKEYVYKIFIEGKCDKLKGYFNFYEEALEEGLKNALEMIKI